MENKNMERKIKYTFDLDYKKMWESATDKALVLQQENKKLKEDIKNIIKKLEEKLTELKKEK